MADPLSWCFSTLGCVEADLPEVVALADRFAIPGIELRGLGGELDPAAALGGARDRHPELWAELRGQGRVRMIGTSFLLSANGAAERAALLAGAELADALACPWLRVFGRSGDRLDLAEAELDRMEEALRWWGREKAARGLRCGLIVETHDVLSSTANCLRLLARCEAPILWDAHHTWCAAGEPFAATWRALGPRIRHVHVKDSAPAQSGRHGCLPGRGDVPIPELLALLRRAAFAGAVSLEWERRWEPHLPELPLALAALTAWRAA